jgi:hypothetical protein
MNLTTDNLQRLLTFPFRGPDWKTRLGVAVLVIFAGWIVPIFPWLIMTGYAIQIARRVALEGKEPELIPWTDWSTYLVDGFKVSLTRVVLTLPIAIVFVGAYFLIFGSAITGGVLGESGGQNLRDIGSLIAVLGSMTGIGLFLLLIPVLLVVALVLPVPSMHVAITGQVGAMFRFREWWRILRADVGAWAIGYLVVIAIGMLVNVVTSVATATIILCFVVPFFMVAYMAYSMLITEVVFAMAYRSSIEKLGQLPGSTALSQPTP